MQVVSEMKIDTDFSCWPYDAKVDVIINGRSYPAVHWTASLRVVILGAVVMFILFGI